jgi:hypothetical protein
VGGVVKVLYALANYPQLSETYIEAEIDYVRDAGVKVEVWSRFRKNASVPCQVPVHRGLLIDAISAFKPDILHVHYLMFPQRLDWDLGKTDLPMTVRGHSFDFSVSMAQAVAKIPRVKKLYLFPHLARQVEHEKVVALPVAYDPKLHRPYKLKRNDMVLRLAAGKTGKGLEDFFAVAKLCKDYDFTLGVADVMGFENYFHQLTLQNLSLPKPVKLLRDLSTESAAKLTAQAGIYLDTNDPKAHPFGMPISIAESLATGSVVLIRDSMAAREYAGDAAFYYSSPEEAAKFINSLSGWTDDMFDVQHARSVLQSQLYASDMVFPRLVHDWQHIVDQRR